MERAIAGRTLFDPKAGLIVRDCKRSRGNRRTRHIGNLSFEHAHRILRAHATAQANKERQEWFFFANEART